jgi:hypothetical protein
MTEDQLGADNTKALAARALLLVNAIQGAPSRSATEQAIQLIAQRKGWTGMETAQILAHCLKTGALEECTALRGKAYRIPGGSGSKIVMTFTPPPPHYKPVFAEPKPETISDIARKYISPAGPPKKDLGPLKNGVDGYDDNGDEAGEEPKEHTMAIEYRDGEIGTQEAADILGVHKSRISAMFLRGELKGRKVGDGSRAPTVFKKADVEKLRDKRAEESGGGEEKPKKARARKSGGHLVMSEPQLGARGRAHVAATGGLAASVMLLIDCVDADPPILTQDDAWNRLRAMVGR